MNNHIKPFGLILFFFLIVLTKPLYSQNERETRGERYERVEEGMNEMERRFGKTRNENNESDRNLTMDLLSGLFFSNNKSEVDLKVESLLKEQKYQEALWYINALIKSDVGNENLYVTRGGLYAFFNRSANAYNDFKKATSINNKNHIAHAGLAVALNNLKENKEALFSINQAISIAPKNANYFVIAGKIYYDLKKYDSADLNYKVALSIKPNVQDARFGLALSRYGIALKTQDVRDYNEALDYLRTATSSVYDRFDKLYWTALILKDMGKYEEALSSINGALFGGPSNKLYLNMKADLLEKMKNYDSALACYNMVCFNDSLLATSFINRASFECRIGKYAEALKDCDRALKISSSNWTRVIRAQANIGLKNYKDALTECNDLLDEKNIPKNGTPLPFEISNFLNIRGYVYYKTAKYKEALIDYEQSMKLKDDNYSYTPYYEYKSEVSAKLVSKSNILTKKPAPQIKKIKSN